MANRKLQTEIEKVLKKVSEGVESFDATLQKIYQASNTTQKEKLEGDLKKEIKKLQRYRDQIKTWISSNEVKDKKPLLDNRKLIESQMEKFKACEKELKTKAFSKEGLSTQAKLDPHEREMQEISDSLRNIMDKLETQIDASEFELEKTKGMVTKRKDKSRDEKIAKLEHSLERLKHHSKMLIIVLRMVANGDLEVDNVKSLIDDVTYFVENNQEPDFEEDEGIYDDFNLDDANYGLNLEEESVGDSDEATETSTTKGKEKNMNDIKSQESLKKNAHKEKDTESDVTSPSKNKERASGSSKISDTTPKASTTPGMKQSAPSTPTKVSAVAKAHAEPNVPISQTVAVAPTGVKYAAAAAAGASAVSAVSGSSTTGGGNPGAGGAGGAGAGVGGGVVVHGEEKRVKVKEGRAKDGGGSLVGGVNSSAAVAATGKGTGHQSHGTSPSSGDVTNVSPKPVWPLLSDQKQTASLQQQQSQHLSSSTAGSVSSSGTAKQTGGDSVASATATTTTTVPQGDDKMPMLGSGGGGGGGSGQGKEEPQASEAIDNRLPSSLKDMVTSFVVTKERSMKSHEESALFTQMLETSFQFVPEPPDIERTKQYIPQNSYPTPSYYPQMPLLIFENSAVYEKFDVDTLFFIFYFRQGTYQQYLAARELKRQSWRFHKKYLTWFQRHEEPKSITDEYEQGTYIYFDYEGVWCQRKKLDFRFDYKYLEDDFV